MKYEPIDVVVPGDSNAVRSHDHPILESGNLSFPKGRYQLTLQQNPDSCSYNISHHIEKAPLVESLVKQGQAIFACIVSSPMSAHRSIYRAEGEHQSIECDIGELGEPPFFTPMVICTKNIEIVLDDEEHGVHPIWTGQKVEFQRGDRLALGSVVQLQSSLMRLLSLHEDKKLGDGQFVVDVASEPFHFRVKVGTKLHKGLRYPNNNFRDHIMTHIVTACLARLKSDYCDDDGDEGWRSIPNLRLLSDYLETRNLGHWCDSEFFPEKVSTDIYPHVLPNYTEDDEQKENGE